jgi:formylglycine-generating enzyme required for sulfatase activity
MSKTLDPYHRWLGIPPKDQPPNHYRLLGIGLFEEDPEVIQDAALRQSAHVRTYQLGRHSELSQRILNEIAAAEACLLDPQKRLTYDQQLRAKKKAEDAAVDEQLKAELPEVLPSLRPQRRSWIKLSKQQILIGSAAAGVAILMLLLLSTVIRTRTSEGTLVVTVDQSDAVVVVADSKVSVVTPGDNQPVEIKVEEGKHTLKVAKGGFHTHTKTFTIKSGAREVFHVTLLPLVAKAQTAKAESTRQRDAIAWTTILPAGAPPPAAEPFDAPTAKKHQQAWAEYLGLSAEQDVDLGDGVKLTFLLIPAGEFMMGSPAEERARFLEEAKGYKPPVGVRLIPTEGPQHRVRITRPFYLGKYEVTQAQWEAVMGGNPSHFTDNPSHPVEQVSWEDVQQFLSKLNVAGTCRVPSAKPPLDSSTMTFTLPTEAQWEYASRAGTTTFWHCGHDDAKLQEYAWFRVNSGGKTHPVGELLANGFGLHDMHGNVWEWCADWYGADYYAQSPPNDPSGPPAGSEMFWRRARTSSSGRVDRGGGFFNHAGLCRSAYRNCGTPDGRRGNLGFRLASVLVDE